MSLGTLPRFPKLGRDVLIRLDNRRRAMPGVPVGVNRGIGCRREGSVDVTPLGRWRAVIDGRADQGVSKADLRSKDEQTIGFSGSNRIAVDPECSRCSP